MEKYVVINGYFRDYQMLQVQYTLISETKSDLYLVHKV